MQQNITLDDLQKLGFTDQNTQIVSDGVLCNIWRKKWICIFVSRESNSFYFAIYKDDKYIILTDVYSIEEIDNLYYALMGERLIEETIPSIDERINIVNNCIKENLDYSFAEQYGIADFEGASEKMNKLAKESECYQKLLKLINNL